jgi:hypothetical protein
MADSTISGLPAGTIPTGPELMPLVQSGVTVQIPASLFKSFIEQNLVLNSNLSALTITLTGSIAAASNQGAYSYGNLTYTDTNIVESYSASVNSYVQEVIQNSNAGALASADVVVSNNLGTSTSYYGDFGINSSGFVGSGSLSLPNATYLTATSGELVLGTTTSNGIHFVTNGGATDAFAISAAGIPTAPTAAANLNNTQVATTAQVQSAITHAQSTYPLNLGASGGGQYSFAGVGTGAQIVYNTSGGAITSILSISAIGSGYVVGDLLNVIGTTGNGDAVVRVMTLSGSGVASLQILYGGTGYTGVGGGSIQIQPVDVLHFYTLTLTGTLTSNALILLPVGTYLTASSQGLTNNNTTGAFTLQIRMATNSNTPIGTGIFIPQGVNNSAATLIQQDGVNDVWQMAPSLNVLATSPTITTPNIVGTTAAGNASAGSVGEVITANATSVAITSATAMNAVSVSLTAGDWDVYAGNYILPTGATITLFSSGLSTTSNTFGAVYTLSQIAGVSSTLALSQSPPMLRVNVSTSTTVYLVSYAAFTGGTAAVSGQIIARRRR